MKRFFVPYISLLYGNLLFEHSQSRFCTSCQHLYQQMLNLPPSILPLDRISSVG